MVTKANHLVPDDGRVIKDAQVTRGAIADPDTRYETDRRQQQINPQWQRLCQQIQRNRRQCAEGACAWARSKKPKPSEKMDGIAKTRAQGFSVVSPALEKVGFDAWLW